LGIPIVTPKQAILGGIEHGLGWHLIDQAIGTTRARGSIDKDTARRLGERQTNRGATVTRRRARRAVRAQ